MKKNLVFLGLLTILLYTACESSFSENPEVFDPVIIIDNPVEPGYDPNISVQENLDNGISILEILANVPVSELYCLDYEGGLIYHVNENDGSGLVVNNVDIDTIAYFGCKGKVLNGADGLDIGTGAQNTLDILKDCNDPLTAAKSCANLVLNGYDDWFLPSIKEYEAMRNNLYQKNCGNFSNFYVSSSEFHDKNMWYIGMVEGKLATNDKDLKQFHVRASRAFK